MKVTNYYSECYFPDKVIVALREEFSEPMSNYIGMDYQSIETIYRPGPNSEGIKQIVLVHLRDQGQATVPAAIDRLQASPYVVYAEPDYYEYAHAIPNDPMYRQLWGMTAIQAPRAWDIATGSPDVIVGVLDSGIEGNHPDLRENFVPGTGAFNGRDQDGHGTHVAGTIGAVGDNRIGVTGVCWRVGLANFRLGSRVFDLATAIAAIDFSRRHRIPILNNSWGGRGDSRALRLAIEQYEGLFVVSAGNNGTNNDSLPMFPASYNSANIISVAATGQNNALASFSNFGARSVHIAAPGVGILSTDINGRYSSMNGTSMAAPHVAGAAALLKAHNPSLSTENLKQIILQSATRTASLAGRVQSGGVLNVAAALAAANRCNCSCRC